MSDISPELYSSDSQIAVTIDQPLGTYDLTLENASGVSTSVEVSTVPYVAPAEPENNIAPAMYPGYYVPVTVPSSATLGDATVRVWTGSEYTDTSVQVVKANVPDPGPNTYDISPDSYRMDDDGSFYIVTSLAGVGVNTLVFTNQSGSGTVDFTVLNAIDNIEVGGVIISPTVYTIPSEPEIIDGNTQPLGYDPYQEFVVEIPVDTELATYDLRISNLSGTSETQVLTVNPPSYAPTDITLTSTSIAEGQSIGTLVGIISTTDTDLGDTFTYELVSGIGDADNTSFAIVGNTLQSAEVFDFETDSSYSVRIKTTDSYTWSYEKQFTITITNAAEGQTGCEIDSNSIWENNTIGDVIGNLSQVGDPDPSTYTFEVTTHTDKFEIANGNQLRTLVSLDADDGDQTTWFNYASSYVDVNIQTTEASSSTVTNTVLRIWVNNIDIILDDYYATEGVAIGSVFAELTPRGWAFGEYPVGTTFRLVDNTDTFEVVGDELKTIVDLNASNWTWFDYGVLAYKSINIEVTIPDVGTDTANMWVWLNNIDEPFTGMYFSYLPPDTDPFPPPPWAPLNEVVPNGSIVGLLVPTGDPDASPELGYAYSIVTQENTTFSVDPITGYVYVSDNQHIDSDGEVYTEDVTFRMRDLSLDVTVDETLTIEFVEVPEVPISITLAPTAILENQTIGTVVGTLSTDDPDVGDTFTYNLVVGEGDADNGSFTVVDSTLVSSEVFDYETKSEYSVRVSTTDSTANTIEASFTITITNIDEAPDDVEMSKSNIKTGMPVNSYVGTVSAQDDVEGAEITYEITVGMDYFWLDTDVIRNKVIFNSNIQQSYPLEITATDEGGNATVMATTITILPPNTGLNPRPSPNSTGTGITNQELAAPGIYYVMVDKS
jgi:hypothetical protein